MARKPARNISQNTAGPKKSRRSLIVLWTSVSVFVLLIFAMPTVIVLFFGMLPTFVAFITDKTPEKYATFCVAGMNFSGVAPYMMDLWLNQHTILAAIDTMTNVFSLFVMYASAGFGWVLFSSIPPVISSFLSALNQRKVINLRARQKELIGDWGEGVAYKEKTIAFDAGIMAAGPSGKR